MDFIKITYMKYKNHVAIKENSCVTQAEMILICIYLGGDVQGLEFIPVDSVGAVGQTAASKQVWMFENLLQS